MDRKRRQLRDLPRTRERRDIQDDAEASIPKPSRRDPFPRIRRVGHVRFDIVHDETPHVLHVLVAVLASDDQTRWVVRGGYGALGVELLAQLRMRQADCARLVRHRAQGVQDRLARDVKRPEQIERNLVVREQRRERVQLGRVRGCQVLDQVGQMRVLEAHWRVLRLVLSFRVQRFEMRLEIGKPCEEGLRVDLWRRGCYAARNREHQGTYTERLRRPGDTLRLANDLLSDLDQVCAVDLEERRDVVRLRAELARGNEPPDHRERVRSVLGPISLAFVARVRGRGLDDVLVLHLVKHLVQVLHLEHGPWRSVGDSVLLRLC